MFKAMVVIIKTTKAIDRQCKMENHTKALLSLKNIPTDPSVSQRKENPAAGL